MKKTLICALAAGLTVGLSSCLDGGSGAGPGNVGPGATTNLVIKLSGVGSATRAVEAPATTAAPDIEDARSLIFVADSGDQIIQAVELVEADATGSGQSLGSVPVGSKVYIVANIPAGADYNAAKALTSIADVKAKFSAVSTQTGFTTPAMANADGAEATVDGVTGVSNGIQTVNIDLKPLVARLEVVAMQAKADNAGNTIDAFNVTGVYVSDYYPNFNYTGGAPAADVAVSLKDALTAGAADPAAVYTGWAGYMKNEGSWPAVAVGSVLMAKDPDGADRVWAYNVVAKGVPQIIFKLEDIVYTNAGGTQITISEPRYLTVEAYKPSSGADVASFNRGEVYRIGAITGGDSNFQFDFSNLNSDPYEESVGLTVKVDVLPWNITDYTPILRP